MTRTKTCLVAALAIVATAGLAAAEVVWVNTESVDIRSSKSSLGAVLVTAKKGQPLEIIAHDGHWLQVKIDQTRTGWVFDSAISAQQVAGGNGFNVGTFGQVSSATAGKGFDQSTEAYAQAKGFDRRPLQHLVDLKHTIAAPEVEKFDEAIRSGTDR